MSNVVELDDDSSRARHHELTGEQRALVAKALEEVLSDPAFKHSRRCSLLLRGLVERALAGNFREFKERTLGVEVFGRQPDYDTNTDPAVRMTANEIRKRLAQFYLQSTSSVPVRIRLVPGSYIPEFDFAPPPANLETSPASPPTAANETTDKAGAIPAASALSPEQPVADSGAANEHAKDASPTGSLPLSGSRLLVAVGILILAVTTVWGLSKADLFRSTQYVIWKPLLQTGAVPLIVVSDSERLQKSVETAPSQQLADIIASRVSPSDSSPAAQPVSLFSDVNSAHRISVWLAEHGQSTVLRPSSGLPLWEFRRAPTILIGYLDNPWSLILLTQLRFKVGVDPTAHAIWIQDQQNPDKREWIEIQQDSGSTAMDYAVISRFMNPETGNLMMAIAGLGPTATEAASQLLTDPAFEKLLPAAARSSKNFQMVIRVTKLTGTLAGSQVLAFHSW
jgi:hypothetical protein